MLLLEITLSASSGAAYRTAFVAPPGKFPANHGASIVELSNGSFLACWYAGTRETAADVQIYCSRSERRGQNWSEPTIAVRAGETSQNSWLSNRTLGNTALHRGADGGVWLFYNAPRLFRGWSATHVAYKHSKDHGKTWSDRGIRLTSYWGNSVRNKPFPLGDGRLLLPMYHEFLGIYGYSCVLTRNSESWGDSQCLHIPGGKHLQPALVRLPDGRIGAYLRNRRKQNILLSVLKPALDGWSAPVPVNLPNPNAAVDIVATASRRLLMIYNNSRVSRSVLSAAVSQDGFVFRWRRDLENDPTSGGFSYPAVIRDGRGDFHVVYTYRRRSAIKYATFDEAWLAGR